MNAHWAMSSSWVRPKPALRLVRTVLASLVSRDEHQQVQRYEGTYPWGAWDDEELPNS